MLTSQRRTASTRAKTDCILYYMTAADFDTVIKHYPKYYDEIIEKAFERLEKTISCNGDFEVHATPPTRPPCDPHVTISCNGDFEVHATPPTLP